MPGSSSPPCLRPVPDPDHGWLSLSSGRSCCPADEYPYSCPIPFGPGTEGGGAVEVLAIGFWAVWLLLCALVNAAVLGALARGPRPPHRPACVSLSQGGSELSEQEGTDRARHVRLRVRRTRALVAPAMDNWLARGYLAVVAASPGFCLYAVLVSPDPGSPGSGRSWPRRRSAFSRCWWRRPLVAVRPAGDLPISRTAAGLRRGITGMATHPQHARPPRQRAPNRRSRQLKPAPWSRPTADARTSALPDVVRSSGCSGLSRGARARWPGP
jgi:hypothetical protein